MGDRSSSGVNEPLEIEFHIGTPDSVVVEMAHLTDSGGWITLLPGVMSEDVPPPRGGLFSLFSSRSGFEVPEATWFPPDRPGKPVQIGVRHDHGPKAVAYLSDRGNPVPRGWRKAMDHPKRGLVVEVPASTDHREVIDWLLSAAILLTRVPLEEDWLARIHQAST